MQRGRILLRKIVMRFYSYNQASPVQTPPDRRLACIYFDESPRVSRSSQVGTAINVAGVAYSVLRGFAKGHLSDVCEEISTFARRSVNQHSAAVLQLGSKQLCPKFQQRCLRKP